MWSSLYRLGKQNNVFPSLHKLTKKKHTGGPFIYQDLKKVIISILFEKVCLGWKFSLIINVGGGGEVGLGMSWVKKIEKLISRVGRILGTHEEFFSNNFELHISFQ